MVRAKRGRNIHDTEKIIAKGKPPEFGNFGMCKGRQCINPYPCQKGGGEKHQTGVVYMGSVRLLSGSRNSFLERKTKNRGSLAQMKILSIAPS